MISNSSVEHFVTLFDSKFLPMGMCLHTSLMKHAQPFHLWILCMDELVERQLSHLALLNVSLISLPEVETAALLRVKDGRTRGEYCWTLTPFAPQFVFDRDQDAKRVTYLDSDIFFFDSPTILLDEFEESGKHVLITEHAYASEYDQTIYSGRFCVQFITFRRTIEGLKVMQWWQERCLEWCYARVEDGKFGDQRYLDDWPKRFTNEVHVLRQIEKTLAPWNLSRFCTTSKKADNPAFYHFHGLRIVRSDRVVLFSDYKIRWLCTSIYERYVDVLRKSIVEMRTRKMLIPTIPPKIESFQFLRTLKRQMRGTTRSVSI